MKKVLHLLALSAVLAVISGCASTDAESEQPWNTPQPWEGVITMPGLNGNQ